jgi:hypothetical protein
MTTRKANTTATANTGILHYIQDDDFNFEGMIDAVRVVYADIQWVDTGCVAGGVEEVSAD